MRPSGSSLSLPGAVFFVRQSWQVRRAQVWGVGCPPCPTTAPGGFGGWHFSN